MLPAPISDRHTCATAARWTVCVLVVVALHVAAGLTLLRGSQDVADAPFPSAVLLELAPEPVAPPPSLPDPVAQPAPSDSMEPPPSEPAEAPEPPVLTPQPSPQSTPEPVPEVVRPTSPSPAPIAQPPHPRPHPTPRRAQATPTPEARDSAQPAAPIHATQAPQIEALPSQAPATWQGALRAHIAQFKRYPALAQRRGEEGVAQVRFTMSRAGQLLSASLVHSSGHSDLDQEALAWIQRAQPLPPPPTEMGEGPVELVIPLRFELH